MRYYRLYPKILRGHMTAPQPQHKANSSHGQSMYKIRSEKPFQRYFRGIEKLKMGCHVTTGLSGMVCHQ